MEPELTVECPMCHVSVSYPSGVDWVALRAPFPPEQVGKLPKGKERDPKSDCSVCGGYHGQGMFHLDYVGHAWITERLNAFGGDWRLRRVDGPNFPDDRLVWMEVELEIGGVVRSEVGCASLGKEEWPKLLWSDALTRAAMRHGIGLSMWQKDTPVGVDREDRPRGAQGRPTAPRASGARSTAQSHDPDLAAVLEVLQGDVAALDQVGLDTWAVWKSSHPGWFKSTEAAIPARNFVMGLLSEGPSEPWAPAGVPGDPLPGEDGPDGTQPY